MVLFGAMTREAEITAKWVRTNWQLLAVVAAVMLAGSRALADIEHLAGRLGIVEDRQQEVVKAVAANGQGLELVLGEIRDLRKDMRTARAGATALRRQ